MKVLFLSPIDCTTEPVIESLTGHDTHVHRYGYHAIPVDHGMLDAADQLKPDIIIYIGSNDPRLMASVTTFQKLKTIAPTVLQCHDASDKTWTPVIHEYTTNDAFSLIVSIDGNDNWAKRSQDFTALTPIPTRFYADRPALEHRSIAFGFAGGFASASRADIVHHCRAEAGLTIPLRNERYGSYRDYARFMVRTRIILNVPWSGSDNATQVKGRVLEAGWAGCVLLEHVDSQARNWFIPEVDYAVYRNKEDAVEQVKALLAEPERMKYLATKLSRRVEWEHHPDIFWNKVFKGVGLNG